MFSLARQLLQHACQGVNASANKQAGCQSPEISLATCPPVTPLRPAYPVRRNPLLIHCTCPWLLLLPEGTFRGLKSPGGPRERATKGEKPGGSWEPPSPPCSCCSRLVPALFIEFKFKFIDFTAETPIQGPFYNPDKLLQGVTGSRAGGAAPVETPEIIWGVETSCSQ